MSTVDPVQPNLGQATCPAPHAEGERVLLGHGSGGQLSARLLRDVIVPALGSASPGGPLEDAAVIPVSDVDLVMSTDSFVVSPLFFPGGDIGSLAVHGTVNDLAMMGGMPIALSVAFVIEEGFPIGDLRRVTESISKAARDAGVVVATGDTKVVGRGAADGLFITTTGIGRRRHGANITSQRARIGDVVLISGPIGLHGTTVLSVREGLGFEADIASDTQPLHRLVQRMLDAGGDDVHVLRDPTRGGLATSVNEIAQTSDVGVELVETAIPVPSAVAGACELLGLDPMHVANEGCLVAFVDPEASARVLDAMRSAPDGAGAVEIGRVVDDHPGRVMMRTLVGSRRVVDMLVGEQLPRIC